MLNSVDFSVWQIVVRSPSAWIAASFIVIVFPILDWAFYFRAQSKFTIYIWNIVAEWSMVFAAAWIMFRKGLSLGDIGQQPRNSFRMLLTLGVLVVVVAALAWLSRKRSKNPSAPELRKAAGNLVKIVPVTDAEQKVYVVVALTAGLCEEFIYRGWLLHLFATALSSLWIGLILSSLAFGFAHLYQGRNVMISSTALGIVFGLLFIASGSLLPAQALHTAIDLTNGIALGKKLRSR